ncbi:VQ protein [Dillenia turbinata]|uniref:VQ protein n=1 Tax=Dillenia turbinata TaxID=194707 RepID=A0AAN8VYR7_9MAGN
MDSGNSGSLSSSGGDEEYESRADSIPDFFTNQNDQFLPISSTHPSSHLLHQSSLFDTASNYGDPNNFAQTGNPHANSLLNLDPVWSRTGLVTRPDFHTNIMGNLGYANSSSSMPTAAKAQNASSSSTALQQPGKDSSTTEQQTNTGGKNPRKRTRASRRAPTTVLTTDTTNFRAMVQEFTGIPAPPFSASPYSRRFDLFAAGSALRSGPPPQPTPQGPLEPLSSLYPLRPSAQKFQANNNPFVSSTVSSTPGVAPAPPSSALQAFLNASMQVDHALVTNPMNNVTPYSLALSKQSNQNFLEMQNPMLAAFQPNSLESLAQLSVPPSFVSKSPDGLVSDHGHGHVNVVIPSHEPSSDTAAVDLRNEEDGNLGNWVSHGEEGSNDLHQNPLMRQYLGTYGTPSTCKLNFSASSSSDFRHDKGPENVSSRGDQANIDSYICSSDN